MSLLHELEQKIIKEEWELEPSGNTYKINNDGVEVCTAAFVNQSTEEEDDLEVAQDMVYKYIVFISNVKDMDKVDQFKSKLSDMGFKKISVMSDDVEECKNECPDCKCGKEEQTEAVTDQINKDIVIDKIGKYITDYLVDDNRTEEIATAIFDDVIAPLLKTFSINAHQAAEGTKLDIQTQYE